MHRWHVPSMRNPSQDVLGRPSLPPPPPVRPLQHLSRRRPLAVHHLLRQRSHRLFFMCPHYKTGARSFVLGKKNLDDLGLDASLHPLFFELATVPVTNGRPPRTPAAALPVEVSINGVQLWVTIARDDKPVLPSLKEAKIAASCHRAALQQQPQQEQQGPVQISKWTKTTLAPSSSSAASSSSSAASSSSSAASPPSSALSKSPISRSASSASSISKNQGQLGTQTRYCCLGSHSGRPAQSRAHTLAPFQNRQL